MENNTNEQFQNEDKETVMMNEEEPPSLFKLSKTNRYSGLLNRERPQMNSVVGCSHQQVEFYNQIFPATTIAEWNSWQWQLKNSFTSIQQLRKIADLNGYIEIDNSENADALPIRITPYYASLLAASEALKKTVIPSMQEFRIHQGEASDPLCEAKHKVARNLVHRYPDRVLFLVTNFCSTYCRYCTRSHMVAKDKCHFNKETLEEAFRYIEQHTEVRDVLLSGGDPLTLSDAYLDFILARLKKISHIEYIRIGTKVPVVLPQRVTRNLANCLKKYHPLFISIHFTHPDELTEEVKNACEILANAGIPLGSQTVLLKGINDDVETMKRLMHGLLRFRVKPYYLYQCDPILGSEHFRTPVEKGLEIIKALRGFTSGYAIPTYVIDAPGGGGKIPLSPDYIVEKKPNKVVLRNFENKIFYYPNIPE